MSGVPKSRIRLVNAAEPRQDASFVLYWMIANRRAKYNFSLQRAVEWAEKFDKPLVVLEALRCDYRWNSDRIHWFVIEGMFDNSNDLEKSSVTYYPYLEPSKGAGKGLLKTLAEQACMVVSDDFPCFFLPKMIEAASAQIPCGFELVDSNGLYPMRDTDKVFARAFDFRRHLQKNLIPHLAATPKRNPLARKSLPSYDLPRAILDRWEPADLEQIKREGQGTLESFPVDHSVGPSPIIRGGSSQASKVLKTFTRNKIENYANDRNQPESNVASGLSPYLHFGHISAHDIFERVCELTDWSPDKVAEKATGSSSGWWGMSETAESFLDELITWREVGYNMCANREDYDKYESLPKWAQKTLDQHELDPRPAIYSLEEFELAETHDPLWNAAQTQLVREGVMHNYLRMLWGKKILHWTETPRDALEVLIELNNKYALDGRNPNSYSGIFWCLGRYDRAWGPERDVFGKVRYMTSESTARKLRVKGYIAKYRSADSQQELF